jgi:hypothetical protein
LTIRPRFTFKRVIKQTGIEGKEAIEITLKDAPDVHQSYYTWC